MKKKVLALVSAVFMLFSLVGCSSEGLALMKEMEEVAKWEATNQSGTMNVDMTVGKDTCNFAFDYTAYTVSDKLQMEMTVTPKAVKFNGESVDLAKGEYKLSPVKLYLDGVKCYMSSAYLKEVFAITGEEVPKTLDLSKDYLAFDMTNYYEQMGIDVKALAKDSTKMCKELYDELAKAKVECPIKQDGRKYTIELSADQMVKAVATMMAQGIAANKDVMVKEYKAMGMTDAQIQLALAQIKAMTSEEALAPITEMIKGSAVKATLAYEDGKQTSEYTMNFNLDISEDEKVTVKFTIKDEAQKAKAKEIKMPTSVKTYTMEDLMKACDVEDTTTAKAETTTTTKAA